MKLGRNYTGLVIGDVGSGKTFIAFLTALGYLINSNNSKVVMIAPTEVLAYQHYQSLFKLCLDMNLGDIDLIYMSAKSTLKNNEIVPKSKQADLISMDSKTIVIGTHSVLKLNSIPIDLVLIDEQHRFGVDQRNNFSQHPHHFISMTATPIPRSLALSLFSKLDTHFVNTLVGRKPVKTELVDFDTLFSDKYLESIAYQYLDNNAKVYIVCPKITIKEGEEKIYSVDEVFEIFKEKFGDIVMSLTGKDKDKKDKLLDFKNNNSKKILISTSVIEVGVDVKEARLMIILNAERFGLAALHQLRGRVGRNNFEDNCCNLVTDKKYLRSKRLQVLTKSNDGFEISKMDLELRGSGELSGAIQSGFSEEIDTITKSSEDDLSYLQNIVNHLNLGDLPRLQNYINKRLQNYHGE